MPDRARCFRSRQANSGSGLTTTTCAPARLSVRTCDARRSWCRGIPRVIGARMSTHDRNRRRGARVGCAYESRRRYSDVPQASWAAKTPGTAQLAATASISGTPLLRSNTRKSPVRASTAVIRSLRSAGQVCTGSREVITARRASSDTVLVPSVARRPMRVASFSGVLAPIAASPKRAMVHSEIFAAISSPYPSSCALNESSSGTPVADACSDYGSPAEVPTKQPAVRKSRPASEASPRKNAQLPRDARHATAATDQRLQRGRV